MSAHSKSKESPEHLFARIKPLLDAVDLDNLDDEARGAIDFSELSGPLNDDAKCLLALHSAGVISTEQTNVLYDYVDQENEVMNVVASMRMSGFKMPDEVIEKVRLVMSGELDGDEEIARILAPYKSKSPNPNTSK